MTDLPVGIPITTVTGWFTQAVADTLLDANRAPDMLPMIGSITFTPNVTRARVGSALPQAMTVFPRPIVCTLDFEGYLSGPDSSRNVVLIATGDIIPSYTVKFDLLGVPTFSLVLLLPTSANPIDLSTALEVRLASTPNVDAWAAIIAQVTAQADRSVASALALTTTAYINVNDVAIAIDTDGVPYFAAGLAFENAVPVLLDTDGVPYLTI